MALLFSYCLVQDESFLAKKNIPGKLKTKKKNDIEQMELLKKKVKILGDGIKVSLLCHLSVCVRVYV